MRELLDAALAHHAEGCPVISVTRDKRPYHEGWNKYFTRTQTEAEVREQFSNGAYGIAMVLFPASPYAVLDFDGRHAHEAWALTGIELPETARNFTKSGGQHLYFRMPAEVPALKRKVRVAKVECDCVDDGNPKHCGVDLLINGYAIIPPTPGYGEDSDFPLEDAVIIPPEILVLATATQKPAAEARQTGDRTTGRVRAGQRSVTACSLAGTMRTRGMSIESIAAALRADNQKRFDPPLSDKELECILMQAEKWAPGSANTFEHLTDMGNARRLVNQYGQDLRHSHQRGWFVWSGKRWEQDETGAVERLAKATVRLIYAEAAGCEDDKIREKIADHAHRSESDPRIKAIITQARSEAEVVVKQGELDADPWLLNVANGTLNLQTSELAPHKRENLITKLAPVDYIPDALCPTWLSFLERVNNGDVDQIRFLQKAVGYSLTGSTGEQCFFPLYGTGANGKSTFLKIATLMLGDYAMQTRMETLMAKRGDQIPNDVARLAGARFVASVEMESGRRLNESLVKQLTGGDRITARFLHHEYFEFDPTFKLWLGVNHKPKISGTDNAIWRRIRLIPFTVTIPENERDPNLVDKLRDELPGILAWAVQGCELWQEHGIKAPATVKGATAVYREESDPLAAFLDDCCELEPDAEIGKPELYKAFKQWTQEVGERDIGRRDFNVRIAERGFAEDRNKKTRLWKGLKLLGAGAIGDGDGR